MPRAKKEAAPEVAEEVADQPKVERSEYEIVEVSNGNLFRVYKDKEQAEAFVQKFPGYFIR